MRTPFIIKIARKRIQRSTWRITRDIDFEQPREPIALVVIAGLTRGGIDGPGKVQSHLFFPSFCRALRRNNIATVFVRDAARLRNVLSIDAPTVVINIYNETQFPIDDADRLRALQMATLVFNAPKIGEIIAEKQSTHDWLTSHGISMPSTDVQGRRMFSSARGGSRQKAWIVDVAGIADNSRYNTEFIDTRVDFKGRRYWTAIRLMCVGSNIVHSFVRARDASEDDPSVHAKDTPIDPDLVEHLQTTQVIERMHELNSLATSIADALGPGFYGHDILIDRENGRLYLCETNFKLSVWAYTERLHSIRDRLPSHAILFSAQRYAEKSANCFIDVCRAEGVLSA